MYDDWESTIRKTPIRDNRWYQHAQSLALSDLHCVSEKESHLMFDNNFGKCGPIFKILSLIDL